MTTIESRPGLAADAEMYEVAPRRSVLQHLTDIWTYRELFRQLVRKELKVKYKNSTLGFAWSMLNPAFLMLVYWLVFSVFLKNPQPNFPIWILSGVLVWSFFSSSLAAGTNSITGNSYLVGKVRFPREILPLSTVGAALIHFLLQTTVVLVGMLAFGINLNWGALPLVVPALFTALLLAVGLAMLLSAINVYARDTQHLLELLLLAWFWLCPILVPYQQVAAQLDARNVPGQLIQLNPMTAVVTAMQRAIYSTTKTPVYATDGKGHRVLDASGTAKIDHLYKILPDASLWWYFRNLAIVFAIAGVLFVIAIKVFDKAEGNFAEVM